MKKTLRRDANTARWLSQKFSPRRRSPSRGAGWPKFKQLEMVTTFTYKPSLVRIDVRNFELKEKVNVKVHTLDIAPLRSESPPQKSSGIERVLKGFHSFTCTPTRSSVIGMSHTCLCLPSRNWHSFTDPGGMEG